MTISILPNRIAQWSSFSMEAGAQYGVEWLLILAILEIESGGGAFLDPKGPSGTGDRTPRRWDRYKNERWAEARLRHWVPTQDEFDRLMRNHDGGKAKEVYEICLPIQGGGFGCGLMQLDRCDPANFEFLDSVGLAGAPLWADPFLNIMKGAEKLGTLLRLFQAARDPIECTAAAYNAGPARVWHALTLITEPSTTHQRIEAINSVTEHGKYSKDVIAQRDAWHRALSLPARPPTPEGSESK